MRGFAPHQPLFDAELACDAPSYVALMLGVRFLTDHLTGDHYFRVAHAGQNLQRAQQQFDLCQQFVSARAQLLGLCRT